MSDFGLKPTGFIVKRTPVILAEINEGTKSVFGESFNVAPSSPQGQFNGIIASAFGEIWEQMSLIYGAFDPSAAQEVQLSRLVQLNGLERKDASSSTVTALFSGNNGTTIPKGFQVAVTGSNEIFITLADATIVAGTAEVAMESQKKGSIVAEAGTLVNIVNPRNGIVSVTNQLNAIVGQDVESDLRLRPRRDLSTSLPALGLMDTILANVLTLDNVLSAKLYENPTSSSAVGPNNPHGLPPHTIWLYCQGGDETQIANAIFVKYPPGVEARGSIVIEVPGREGIPVQIGFSRPVLQDIFVTINTNGSFSFPADGIEQIQKAILAYAKETFKIGTSVERTRLYTPINSIPGHSVQELFIGLTANPTGVVDIPIEFNELAQFLTINILVNVN
jgi:uncharacterized phage protein gp47/JayE